METSYFSKLSAELRNEIYYWSLKVPEPVLFHGPGQLAEDSPPQASCSAPGLLSTCHQIREEALQMYYAVNTFQMQCGAWQSESTDGSCLGWILKWLDDIGPGNRTALTSVNVDLGEYSEVFGRREEPCPRQSNVTRRVHGLAPFLTTIATRLSPGALSLSSVWIMEQHTAGLSSIPKSGRLEMRKLRIFQLVQSAMVPYVRPNQNGIWNTTINGIFSACLIGNARAIMIMLIHSTWLYFVERTTEVSQHAFDAGRRSLEDAFRDIDDQCSGRALTILPDEFRGYSVSVEVLDEALDNVDHYESWITETDSSRLGSNI